MPLPDGPDHSPEQTTRIDERNASVEDDGCRPGIDRIECGPARPDETELNFEPRRQPDSAFGQWPPLPGSYHLRRSSQ